jgi:hypothetical protein
LREQDLRFVDFFKMAASWGSFGFNSSALDNSSPIQLTEIGH